MLLKMLANEQFSDLSNELKTEYQKIGDQWLVAENFKPLLNTAVKNDDESSLQAIALLIKKNQSWQVHNGLIKEQIFSRDRNLEETKSLVNLYEIAFSAQTSELLPGLTHKLLQTNDKYLKNWIGTWIDNNLKNENQLNAIAGLAHSNDPLVVLFYMIQLAKFPTTENIDKILAYVSLPQNLVTDEALARLSKIKLSESYIPQLLKMLENPLDERKSFALTLLSKNFKQVPSNSKIVALIDQFIRELEIQIKVSGKDDDDYSMGSIPYGISKTGSLRLKLIQYLSLSL